MFDLNYYNKQKHKNPNALNFIHNNEYKHINPRKNNDEMLLEYTKNQLKLCYTYKYTEENLLKIKRYELAINNLNCLMKKKIY